MDAAEKPNPFLMDLDDLKLFLHRNDRPDDREVALLLSKKNLIFRSAVEHSIKRACLETNRDFAAVSPPAHGPSLDLHENVFKDFLIKCLDIFFRDYGRSVGIRYERVRQLRELRGVLKRKIDAQLSRSRRPARGGSAAEEVLSKIFACLVVAGKIGARCIHQYRDYERSSLVESAVFRITTRSLQRFLKNANLTPQIRNFQKLCCQTEEVRKSPSAFVHSVVKTFTRKKKKKSYSRTFAKLNDGWS